MHPAGELESWLDWDQGAFGYRWADGGPNNPLVRTIRLSVTERNGATRGFVEEQKKSKERRGWLIFPVAFAPLFLVLFGFSVLLLYLVSFSLGKMVLVWSTSYPCDPIKIRELGTHDGSASML